MTDPVSEAELGMPLMTVNATVMADGSRGARGSASSNSESDGDDDVGGPAAAVGDFDDATVRCWMGAVGWRRIAGLLMFIMIMMALLGKNEIVKAVMRIDEASGRSTVVLSDGDMVRKMGLWSERCYSPAEYACGEYSRTSLRERSSFGDAQLEADALLEAAVRELSGTDALRIFYDSCTSASESVRVHGDPNWWWDRGLQAHNLMFGRARSNASRFRYLAVQHIDPDGDVRGSCTLVSKSVCGGRLWAQAARLGSHAPFDESICVIGAPVDEVCDRYMAVYNTTVTDPVVFSPAAPACVAEVKRLWPTATSELWERVHGSANDDAELQLLFDRTLAVLESELQREHQIELKNAISSVKLRTSYVGPPEVYHDDWSDINSSTVVDAWERLILEKETLDRSRLYFTAFDWDMSSHTINAYYWPYANAVFVTPALSRWMQRGATDAARLGRLGFLLGHELGHAVSSSMNHVTSLKLQAEYHAGKLCLMDEYGNTGQTVEEDMADQIGFGVVGRLAWNNLKRDTSTVFCPGSACTEAVNPSHVAFLGAAQCFCSARAKIRLHDPHSADMVRLRHSVLNSKPALEAWGCNSKDAPVCKLTGVPVLPVYG